VIEDEIINFDITQEIMQTFHHIEIEVAKNATTVELLVPEENLPNKQI
jgi:hypothetical protein